MSAESLNNSPVISGSQMSLQDFIGKLKTFSTASQQADFINTVRCRMPGVLAEIVDDVPAFVSVLSVLYSERPDAQNALINGLKKELETPLNVTILGLLKRYSDPATQAVFIKTTILWDDNPYQPVTILQKLDKKVHQLFIERLGMVWLGRGDKDTKFKITKRDLTDTLAQIDPSLAPVLMNALARCARTIDEYNHLSNIVVPTSYLRLFIEVALPILATTICLPSDLQAVLFNLPAEEAIKVLEFLSPLQWQTIISDERTLANALSRNLPGGKKAPPLESKILLTLVTHLSPRLSVNTGILMNDIYLDGKLLTSDVIPNMLEPYVLSNKAGLDAWKDAESSMRRQERNFRIAFRPEFFLVKTLSRGLHKLAKRPFIAIYLSGDEKSILKDLFFKIQSTLNRTNISIQQLQTCQDLLQETLNTLDQLNPQGTGVAFLQVAKQQLRNFTISPVSVHREDMVEDHGAATSSYFQSRR